MKRKYRLPVSVFDDSIPFGVWISITMQIASCYLFPIVIVTRIPWLNQSPFALPIFIGWAIVSALFALYVTNKPVYYFLVEKNKESEKE